MNIWYIIIPQTPFTMCFVIGYPICISIGAIVMLGWVCVFFFKLKAFFFKYCLINITCIFSMSHPTVWSAPHTRMSIQRAILSSCWVLTRSPVDTVSRWHVLLLTLSPAAYAVFFKLSRWKPTEIQMVEVRLRPGTYCQLSIILLPQCNSIRRCVF